MRLVLILSLLALAGCGGLERLSRIGRPPETFRGAEPDRRSGLAAGNHADADGA